MTSMLDVIEQLLDWRGLLNDTQVLCIRSSQIMSDFAAVQTYMRALD